MAARAIDSKAKWIDPVGLREFSASKWWPYRLFTYNDYSEDGDCTFRYGTMHQCPSAMETTLNLIKCFKLAEEILNHKREHEAYITPRLCIAVLESNSRSMVEAFRRHDETIQLETANPFDHEKWDTFKGC